MDTTILDASREDWWAANLLLGIGAGILAAALAERVRRYFMSDPVAADSGGVSPLSILVGLAIGGVCMRAFARGVGFVTIAIGGDQVTLAYGWPGGQQEVLYADLAQIRCVANFQTSHNRRGVAVTDTHPYLLNLRTVSGLELGSVSGTEDVLVPVARRLIRASVKPGTMLIRVDKVDGGCCRDEEHPLAAADP